MLLSGWTEDRIDMAANQVEVGSTVIDFAGHIHPEPTAPDGVKQLNQYVGEHHTDVEALIRWYDRSGYDGAALSQPAYMGHGDAEAVAEANDVLLDGIADRPNYFGLAAIPTAAGGESAAAEFQRALDEGYHGGAIETKTDGLELVDREVEPVLEVADQTGVPVLVHPKLDDSLEPGVFDDRYLLNAIFGREVALCESLTKVIHEGVLERYPNLTLVYHHTAGNLASMIGRIEIQLRPDQFPGQEHVVTYEEFESALRERIYIDTCGFLGHPAPLEAALDIIPPSHVLFGTDTPYEARTPAELGEYAAAVKETVDKDVADQILASNARALLD